MLKKLETKLSRMDKKLLSKQNLREISQSATVESGVPQGWSILGPVPFIMFTNDFQDIFPEDVQTSCYADDAQILVSGKTVKEVQ